MRPLILLMALSAPAWAWDFSYSATTVGAPVWNRPVENLSGTSLVGLAVGYQAYTFVAAETAVHTITSTAAGGWDNFLVLYQGAFNPSAPLTNAIAANDDFGFIGQSRIVRSLTAGTSYTIVTTAFLSLTTGAFTNTISTPTPVPTPTPEPSTWLMMGLGCVGIWRMRKGRELQPARVPVQRK